MACVGSGTKYFGSDEMFYNLIVVMIKWVYKFVKIQQKVYLKWVHDIICK